MATEELVLGSVCEPDPGHIVTSVWRHIIDPKTGKETARLHRERMRTLGEVYRDLDAALRLRVCEKCGAERKSKGQRDYGTTCKACGGDEFDFIDEYLSGPERDESMTAVPTDYRWLACYPVTGGSEGHYVHVDFMTPATKVRVYGDGDFGEPKTVTPLRSESLWRPVRLALAKTFRGMDHAAKIASRCAVLLGA